MKTNRLNREEQNKKSKTINTGYGHLQISAPDPDKEEQYKTIHTKVNKS